MNRHAAVPMLIRRLRENICEALPWSRSGFYRHGHKLVSSALYLVDSAPYSAALGFVVLPFAIVAVHLAMLRRPVYLNGDWALLDVDVRAALRWHLLLGPYDRFGWHHPGPALAYLLSIVARLIGPGGIADDIGIVAINAGAALAAVVIVRRRVGRIAALWAAVCLSASCAILGPGNLVTAWGPNVVFLPLVLLTVLCADAASGHKNSLVGALIVATFEVQTQLGTAPVVLVLITITVIALVLRHRKGDRPTYASRRSCASFLGWGLLVIMWLPPVVEQVQHLGQKGGPTVVSTLHPNLTQVSPRAGNLVAIYRFLIAKHASHSIGSVMKLLAPNPWMLLLLGGACLVAIAIGRRTPDGLGTYLGWMALAIGIITPLAVTRVVGTIQGFDLSWDRAVPVVAALGAGVSVFVRVPDSPYRLSSRHMAHAPADTNSRLTFRWTCFSAILLFTAAVVGARFAGRMTVWNARTISSPLDRAAWQLVRGELHGAPSVRVDALEGSPYGIAASIADDLIARGIRVTVPPGWAPEFGASKVGTGRAAAEVVISSGVCTASRDVKCLHIGNGEVELQVIRS